MKLKKVFVALGFAFFIPISGCSQLSGIGLPSVSKNCDELAPKYLKAMFSKQQKNNKLSTKKIVVVKEVFRVNSAGVEMPYAAGDHSDKEGYNYSYKFNAYEIDKTGSVQNYDNMSTLYSSPVVKLTIPTIASSKQIICNYPELKELYKGKIHQWGEDRTVSEDIEGITEEPVAGGSCSEMQDYFNKNFGRDDTKFSNYEGTIETNIFNMRVCGGGVVIQTLPTGKKTCTAWIRILNDKSLDWYAESNGDCFVTSN